MSSQVCKQNLDVLALFFLCCLHSLVIVFSNPSKRSLISLPQRSEWEHRFEQIIDRLLVWLFVFISEQMGEGDEWTEEPNVLVLLHLEEFLSMVHNYKQVSAYDFCVLEHALL